MRFPAKSALLLLSLLAIPAAQAQKNQAQQKRESANRPNRAREDADLQYERPLTLDEGLAVIGAALDSRHHLSRADCSHFVHGLYSRAGFPYAYAPSSDLYAGVDEFRRVTNPQPGDLAVWRGHTGIVVNPAQHSFFSLLRSGPGIASYESSYWRKKGHPRFYRYVSANRDAVLSSSLHTPR